MWLVYRLLWLADNGSVGTMNYWKQGDIALCQTFNITEPGNYTNVQNQYYKRVVCRVGQTNITEGGQTKTYHYADLANIAAPRLFDANDQSDANGWTARMSSTVFWVVGTVPKAGDKVVACGSQADTNRQGCVLISAEGEASIGIYDGIKDYQSLSVYEIHYLSKTEVRCTDRSRSAQQRWHDNAHPGGFEIAIGNCGIDIDNEIIKLNTNKVNFYDASGTNPNPKIYRPADRYAECCG